MIFAKNAFGGDYAEIKKNYGMDSSVYQYQSNVNIVIRFIGVKTWKFIIQLNITG